jgi:hypothetical protein
LLLLLSHILVFQEVIPDWQTAASSILVAVSGKYCNDVMTELLEKFQPGVLPHFFVVQTLANMATANGDYLQSASHDYSLNMMSFYSADFFI